MQSNPCSKLLALVALTSTVLLCPAFLRGQDAPKSTPPNSSQSDQSVDVRALSDAVRELQGQVQALTAQLKEMRAQQQQAFEEARELRRQLSPNSPQQPTSSASSYSSLPSPAPAETSAPASPNTSSSIVPAQEQTSPDTLAKLEEDVQFIDAKINDQYQTKVESGSKYRLRLSGIILLNMFDDRGLVDNADFPSLAAEPQPGNSAGAFGGTLRQSQVNLQAFGPDIAGAHTSADLSFDFAGGFPDTPYGVSTGLVRLRTGVIHMDWTDTSLVVGQDQLFFAPIAPTSLASLAIPALSYAGNLWSWTPQVRIEHRVHLSESSALLFQGGILDSLTGDPPANEYYRYPTAGESSGQPAYAARIAWSHKIFGQDLVAGFGGYYARQNWGFSRNVDGWTGSTDITLPLGPYFGFSGEFYRGRAVGGLGGGIGQSIVQTGPLTDPATSVFGLNSIGGWAQLKFKPKPKFEVNGAFGQDNPFANQVNLFASNPAYYDAFVERNRTGFVNFIYQPRSDVLFGLEYRRLCTFYFGGDSDSANHVNISLGYIF